LATPLAPPGPKIATFPATAHGDVIVVGPRLAALGDNDPKLRSAAASCCSMEALRMILGEKVDHILNINEYI
jgi:hypothetical protein